MKNKAKADDDLRPEYDWSNSRPNAYAARMKGDVVVVVLDAELAKAFPTAAKARKALRSMLPARAKAHKRAG